MNINREKFIEIGRRVLICETLSACVWAAAAGVTLAGTIAYPGEGVILAVQLVILMILSGAVAVNAKEAVSSMKMLSDMKRGMVGVRVIQALAEEDTHKTPDGE